MEAEILQELVAAWQGAEVPVERQQFLLAKLRADQELRQALVGEIRMIGMVRTVTSSEPRWLSLADILGREPGYDSQMVLLEERMSGHLAKSESPIVPAWWRPAAIAAIIIVAMLAIVAGWLLLNDRSKSRPVADTQTLAVAVEVHNCEWENAETQKPILNSSVSAGRLRLRSGELTLAFLSGVTVNMDGPVAVDLRGADLIYCKHGELRVNVPESIEEFTLQSPGASVTERGAEYTAEVMSNGVMRVMVLRGNVHASVLSADGAAVKQKLVEESNAVEIDPREFRINDITPPSRVLAAPALSIPKLKLTTNYSALVRSSKPWSYWRCNTIIDGTISNELSGGPILRLIGALTGVTESPGNSSIVYPLSDRAVGMRLEETWTPPASGCAIELWFASAAYNAAALASVLSDDESEASHMLVELVARGTAPDTKPGAVRFLYSSPPGDAGGVNLYSKKLYVPFRWHHLLAQRTGNTMQLFIDGEPAGESKLDAPGQPIAGRLLLGRLKENPTNGEARTFTGRLDEIAVYDHPLKPEEIRAHAKASAP